MLTRIVVTGGAGFIGSHLCERLLSLEHEVCAFDNFDDFYDPAIKRRNLRQAQQSPHFSLVEGDIRNPADVDRALTQDTDVVVHLAARAGVRPSIEQPLLYESVNVQGTMTLLEACKKLPHSRFIFASSSSVYGNRTKVPFVESDRVDDPISPYAATKKAGELLCYTYHHLHHLPITCLRFFTVYGPRQRPDLAIHKFTRLIETGQPVPVFGEGTLTRDFTYIDDIVDGIVRAMDRCDGYHIYNLGNAHPVSVNELIAMLEKATGKQAQREHKPLQPGDVSRTYADVTLAKRALGYEPTTNLQTGLAHFVRWLRNEKST